MVDIHINISSGTERPGRQSVDVDAGADPYRDHEILHRESKRNRCQCILADLRDKDGIHDVVENLHQHGDHHGDRLVDDQLSGGHDIHLITSFGIHLCFLHMK